MQIKLLLKSEIYVTKKGRMMKYDLCRPFTAMYNNQFSFSFFKLNCFICHINLPDIIITLHRAITEVGVQSDQLKQ